MGQIRVVTYFLGHPSSFGQKDSAKILSFFGCKKQAPVNETHYVYWASMLRTILSFGFRQDPIGFWTWGVS